MYDSILVAVDESDQSASAVTHALETAKRFQSTLHVIRVIEESSEQMSKAIGELSRRSPERQKREERKEQVSSDLIESVVQRAEDDGVTIEGAITTGDPAEEILEYATAEEIDLIVLGTRRQSAVGKLLLGDVTGKVARNAPMAVLLARPEE